MNSFTELLSKDSAIIMGVLNVTPDSFSDGGRYDQASSSKEHAAALISDGADIIDIGGEATGPGSTPVTAKEELRRLEQILPSIAGDKLVSVDTYKASVASYALSVGARIINDVSALQGDPEMVDVIVEYKAPVVLMYSKDNAYSPHVLEGEIEYDDVIGTIKAFLEKRIEFALQKGVQDSQIVLDPGMGRYLSPNPAYSFEVLRRFNELASHFKAFPMLIGTSRKGFLGGKVEERDPLSQLTALEAVKHGARIVRTHNPEMMASFLRCYAQLLD